MGGRGQADLLFLELQGTQYSNNNKHRVRGEALRL